VIETCKRFAYPLANAIKCALEVTKTGVVALSSGSLVAIPGLNLSPHELMGYLINLSFKPVHTLQHKFISLSPADKTLGDIVKKIGLECISPETVDVKSPILVVTETVQLNIVIGSYTYKAPIDAEYVEEYAIKNGLPVDTLILSEFPLHQENIFTFKVDDIGGNKSRISFTNVPESAVREVLVTLPDLLKN
jgi:hypothetical protein